VAAVSRAKARSAPQRRPSRRRLRAFAFDPSLSAQLDTFGLNVVTLSVPWEDLEPGPVGEYVEVVDVDPPSGLAYPPVDLDALYLLAQDGLAPSEGDPQFHQQMVYAVAMTTIRRFEEALGRRALWSVPREGPDRWRYVQRLRIYPHALREANAYYSPEKKALLFGYFPASRTRPGTTLPGGLVFTCLSHDVVAHETTHALLDGMHRRFAEPSNPDVLAFHEAFADVVALFQHFSFPDVLRHQIARTRGDLAGQNLLGELAQQFGQATGGHGALRDALGSRDRDGVWRPREPDPTALARTEEPHERGSILVAAVFGAFLQIYRARIADLLRIATGGSGVLPPGELHPDLVSRLSDEAAKAAHHVQRMCIRALDYCPPVDVTFGDYLRALVTADRDLIADDERGYRVALIESFRQWGIYPEGVRSLSEESLLWQPPTETEATALRDVLGDAEVLRSLCPDWGLSSDRRAVHEQAERNQERLQNGIVDPPHEAAARAMGLTVGSDAPGSILRSRDPRFEGVPRLEVHAVRPARRVTPDGEVRTDLVVVATQRRHGYDDPEVQAAADKAAHTARAEDLPPPDFIFRGGCTLLVDLETGGVRYVVRKDVLSERRLAAQRAYLVEGLAPALRGVYFGRRGRFGDDGLREPFAFLHSGPRL